MNRIIALLRNRLASRVISASAILLILMGTTVASDRKTLIESGAGAALGPVQMVMYSANKRLETLIDFFLRYEDIKVENAQLSQANTELEAKLREYEMMKTENESLKSMFSFKDRRAEYDYLGVNIINVTGSGIITAYTIDRGSNDGIVKGMAVMSPDGIVGQVTEVSGSFSIIETISSENISIHVKVVETSENSGILQGQRGAGNEQLAKVTYLPADSLVKAGDSIVTSGLGGFYPPDIYVGEVVSVAEDKGKLMMTAVVKPAVDFDRAEKLYVVVPKIPGEVEY
ncbi:rod shape-determining protein MreC [Youngiibacter multivorans]|uniref:Cell shape-determining protein MreC n=1 Tax=Youngiibacter multivorans TaxID=937251 RepID=A0ABS4G4T6_9CLOT|nr:rod shape-determining protein MreC [Youngiibacter multivorans]MBP1919553.1 rod shape-determining protein MreC [Youngiibacter multivorans]